MNTRRLYILLVAWCAFLLAPGVLVALGLFGRLDMRTNFPGGLALLWVLGYLAQFFTFMALMNVAHKQRIVWWFIASLLPWAVDWSQPVSPWFLLGGFVVTIAVALWIAHDAREESALIEHGVRATGVVLQVFKPLMNVVINNVYIKRKLRLRIEREDGVPAYEGILHGLFMLGEIPSVGDRLPLRVDPAKPQRFEIDDTDTSATAAAAANFHESRATPSHSDMAGQLERLARLRDRGALTASEFDAAKKKLLSR
jgi:hypothetical protein